jgi:hypothetical protein
VGKRGPNGAIRLAHVSQSRRKVPITGALVPSAVLVEHAQNQDVNPATRCIGPGTVYGGGARGNVRDSDTTPSKCGNVLWNWGANFDFTVP